jgi:hypothetical protein
MAISSSGRRCSDTDISITCQDPPSLLQNRFAYQRSLECEEQAIMRLIREIWLLTVILGFSGIAYTARAQSPSPPPPATESATPSPPAESATTTPATTIARAPSPSDELNTLLMHATFLISGRATFPGQLSFGTVFVMGIPQKDRPKVAQIIMVSAAHVFESIGGDTATLQLRRKNIDGTYVTFGHQIAIRKEGHPLYVRHPTADVAVMYGDLPDEVPMSGLPPDFLVTDKSLEELEVHPGDEAFILGFPAAVSTPGGFPVLRVGHIASYPLTPMGTVKQWAFDAHILSGNSGGPVYFTYVNRVFKGQLHFGVGQGLLGLVIQEGHSMLPEFANRDLEYAVIVPAKFIRETIDMLPPLPEQPATQAQPPDVTGTIK